MLLFRRASKHLVAVNRRHFLQVGALSVLGAGVGGAVLTGKVGGTVAPTRTLLWSEDFESLDLVSAAHPSAKWRANDLWQPLDKGYIDFGSGGSYFLNPNQALDGAPRSPFSVENSVLTIRSIRTPPRWNEDIVTTAGWAPRWCGGALISNSDRADMTFGYGYYEFRAQWPVKGRGMFPAIWFFAAYGKNTSTGKTQAEIDVLEIFGHPEALPWDATLHEKDSSGAGRQIPFYTSSEDTARWHTYGLDWRADELALYRDDKKVATVTGSSADYFADTKMGIRLSYAMDANWFGADQKSDQSTPNELLMNIDYIRKYDNPPGRNPG